MPAIIIRLVDRRGLWIAAQALGPAYLTRHPGVHRSDWIPDSGAAYCTRMVDAVHRANRALQESNQRVDHLRRTGQPGRSQPVLWETVAARERSREGRRNDHPPTVLSIGI